MRELGEGAVEKAAVGSLIILAAPPPAGRARASLEEKSSSNLEERRRRGKLSAAWGTHFFHYSVFHQKPRVI